MNIKGLEAVITPLIDSLVPPFPEPPWNDLTNQVDCLILVNLGHGVYVDIVRRMVLNASEKDPVAFREKLETLREQLQSILDNNPQK